jgi:hypothetical protein
LTADPTSEQLSKHASELDSLLPDWMTRRCVKVALTNGTNNKRLFSKEKIKALLPDKRKEKLTIERRAEYCATAGDTMDIFTYHLDLGLKNKDENEIIANVSCQSTFCVKLAEGSVDPAIIKEFAKDKKLIQDSNKIQKEQTKKRIIGKFFGMQICAGLRIDFPAQILRHAIELRRKKFMIPAQNFKLSKLYAEFY